MKFYNKQRYRLYPKLQFGALGLMAFLAPFVLALVLRDEMRSDPRVFNFFDGMTRVCLIGVLAWGFFLVALLIWHGVTTRCRNNVHRPIFPSRLSA